MLDAAIEACVVCPVGSARAAVFERNVGEVFDEREVELPKVDNLIIDDVGYFLWVFCAYSHAWITEVAKAGDLCVELLLGKGRWEGEESSPEGGDEVDLICETNARVVAEDLDWLLEATGEVEVPPLGEIGIESVQIDHTVLEHDAVHYDIWVVVDAGPNIVLNF